VSAAISYRIVDAVLAVNSVESYATALHTEVQLALRQVVGGATIDECLEQRAQLPGKAKEIAAPRLAAIGIEVGSLDIKDIMFPGQLKETFAKIVNARKEAAASLERTRGETASLRYLANAARLFDESPSLMNLRIIQAITESKGNTFVLPASTSGPMIPIPTQKPKP
jgi:regulator of protease activity HflC (stomatin/prohibitin superfamily)